VRNHLASLYRKIGVNRRSAVVVWARERGIGEFAPNGNTKPGKLG
jgi:DNA-binding NarL/FixJ family response regulator